MEKIGNFAGQFDLFVGTQQADPPNFLEINPDGVFGVNALGPILMLARALALASFQQLQFWLSLRRLVSLLLLWLLMLWWRSSSRWPLSWLWWPFCCGFGLGALCRSLFGGFRSLGLIGRGEQFVGRGAQVLAPPCWFVGVRGFLASLSELFATSFTLPSALARRTMSGLAALVAAGVMVSVEVG